MPTLSKAKFSVPASNRQVITQIALVPPAVNYPGDVNVFWNALNISTHGNMHHLLPIINLERNIRTATQ